MSTCPEEHLAEAEQAAENGSFSVGAGQEHPAGAEARLDFEMFMARLKSCSFKKVARKPTDSSFFSACKVRAGFEVFAALRESGTFKGPLHSWRA